MPNKAIQARILLIQHTNVSGSTEVITNGLPLSFRSLFHYISLADVKNMSKANKNVFICLSVHQIYNKPEHFLNEMTRMNRVSQLLNAGLNRLEGFPVLEKG